MKYPCFRLTPISILNSQCMIKKEYPKLKFKVQMYWQTGIGDQQTQKMLALALTSHHFHY